MFLPSNRAAIASRWAKKNAQLGLGLVHTGDKIDHVDCAVDYVDFVRHNLSAVQSTIQRFYRNVQYRFRRQVSPCYCCLIPPGPWRYTRHLLTYLLTYLLRHRCIGLPRIWRQVQPGPSFGSRRLVAISHCILARSVIDQSYRRVWRRINQRLPKSASRAHQQHPIFHFCVECVSLCSRCWCVRWSRMN